MIADVIESYLDNLEEREFDAPFIAMLRGIGFYDIHFTHGPFEFGKDFIAKRAEVDGPTQYAFQTKAGNIGLSEWSGCRGQIDLLRTNALAHPSFDSKLRRHVIFVLTGRLVGGAPLAAQQYRDHLSGFGELGFETWDREKLVELISDRPEVGIAGDSTRLMGMISSIDSRNIDDAKIEEFSRNWYAPVEQGQLIRAALEAAVLGNRLRRTDRLDLACQTALCLVRAAWVSGHGATPPHAASIIVSDAGRALFSRYAGSILEQFKGDVLNSSTLVFANDEPAAFVTFPVRCTRAAELVGLLALLSAEQNFNEKYTQATEALAAFCKANIAVMHPISDHFAVSVAPVVLSLFLSNQQELVKSLFRELIRWIGNHYQEGSLGFAAPYATPIDQVSYFLGSALEHVTVPRRPECYTSTVVMDLAAVLHFSDMYELARNDFLAVEALPSIVESDNSAGQYVFGGEGTRYEANMPYADNWNPVDGWKVSPYHSRAPSTRYLEMIGRRWDLFAISAVLRDRHFVTSWRGLLQ